MLIVLYAKLSTLFTVLNTVKNLVFIKYNTFHDMEQYHEFELKMWNLDNENLDNHNRKKFKIPVKFKDVSKNISTYFKIYFYSAKRMII